MAMGTVTGVVGAQDQEAFGVDGGAPPNLCFRQQGWISVRLPSSGGGR